MEQPLGAPLLALASALLALNLVLALFLGAKFRRNTPLLAFHLCLLLLLILISAGTLTGVRAHFEIAEGQVFSNADLVIDSRGRFASGAPPEGMFRQGRIEVDYASGIERAATRSQVWLNGEGGSRPHTLSDGRPLVIDGYRIYPTHNKGFSAILSWWPEGGGAAVAGAINFPSYPRLSWHQSRSWVTPSGLQLDLELTPAVFPADRRWTLSAQQAGAGLSLDAGGGIRSELRVGEIVAVRGGFVRLEKLGMWMGYRVFYEPTLPWLFAASLLALAALAWWFWARFARSLDLGDRPVIETGNLA
jgi:cytochrome c biogenesis protein